VRGRGVVFSPDGKRLAGTVRVLDALAGQESLTLSDSGRAVAFSPDGFRLCTLGNRELKIKEAKPLPAMH
jgi:WD40 repeat protein